MKNKFTYNVFFDENAKDLGSIMETILATYIKEILNSDGLENELCYGELQCI